MLYIAEITIAADSSTPADERSPTTTVGPAPVFHVDENKLLPLVCTTMLCWLLRAEADPPRRAALEPHLQGQS